MWFGKLGDEKADVAECTNGKKGVANAAEEVQKKVKEI